MSREDVLHAIIRLLAGLDQSRLEAVYQFLLHLTK